MREAKQEVGVKTIHVAGAIIVHGGRLLACQRGYGAMKDGCEFPGGKVEPGESAADACRREIREELGCELDRVDYYHTVEYDYPDFHLSMDCFVCTLPAHQSPHLLEHEAARWLSRAELDSVDWLPADEGLIARIADEWDTVVG